MVDDTHTLNIYIYTHILNKHIHNVPNQEIIMLLSADICVVIGLCIWENE